MHKFAGRFAVSAAVILAASVPLASRAGIPESVPPQSNPLAAAVAWQQTSAEYKALCFQTYNAAAKAIDERIRLGSYTKIDGRLCELTLHEQPDGSILKIYSPLAIVLDIDETVLSNTGVEAWCIKNSEAYDYKNWNAWCWYQGAAPSACREVPGAVDFLLHCQAVGVTPIYITNRDEALREPTRKALEHLGLGTQDLDKRLILRDKKAMPADNEQLLKRLGESAESVMGREIANNYNDKAGRRYEVRAKYKVVGWFGDNIYDMPVYVSKDSSDNQTVLAGRDKQIEDNETKFGTEFFMLPNPFYGSWLKPVTFPVTDMTRYVDDFGFGAWYESHKDKIKGHGSR